MNESKECYKCRNQLLPEHNYCSVCGAGQGRYVRWYYKHWGIILLIFLTGPIAIFFVIFSPIISRISKYIYTAVIIGLTILLGMQAYILYTMLAKAYWLLSYSAAF